MMDKCFQIDHTKLDVFVVDEYSRWLMGRPWLVLKFDNEGNVLDFSVGLAHPFLGFNDLVVKNTNEMTKKQILENDWLVSTLDEEVVVTDVFLTKDSLGIRLDNLSIGHIKGNYERVFESLNDYLKNTLSPQQIYHYLTLSEFKTMIRQWIESKSSYDKSI